MEKLTFINSRGESIVFDGPPFYLVNVNGLGDVSATVQRQKAPYQDGSTRIGSTLEERVIPIEFLIVGENYAEVSEFRIKMARVLNPNLDEGILRYENGHVVREIKAGAESIPFFPDGSGNRTREMQKGLVTLLASDPYWRSLRVTDKPTAAYVELFEFPSDFWEVGEDGDLYFEMGIQGGSYTLRVEGDADAPAQIRLYGPSLNPTITNKTTGEFIRINKAIQKDDVLYIDTETSTIELNGENAFHWIDPSSSFWKLQIGENEIEYAADEGVEDAKSVITWQERYLSV